MITTTLRSTPPFRELDEAAIEEIACHATERHLEPGAALFEQGAPASRFFLILEGRLKVAMITADGKQVLVRLVSPGEFCGLALALARPDYPATARALVATRVLAWPMSCWTPLIEAHPCIALGVTRAIGRQVDEAHTRLAELATQDVERRVAHAVLRLARRAGQPAEGGGVRIDFPLTRQDIAEMTGTTLHSVSRIVSAWSAKGFVRRGRARLVVRDLAALERVARGGED